MLAMKKSEEWIFRDEGHDYPVTVNYRNRRSLGLRYRNEEKDYVCNVPYRFPREEVISFLQKHASKLRKRVESRHRISPYEGDRVYLFGEPTIIEGFSTWNEVKKEKYLKQQLLDFLSLTIEKDEKEMHLKTHYQVKVRKMKSLWGVNHLKQGDITFALMLVHYRKDIIESVVYHELTHDFYRGHGKCFYQVLLKYCPSYWALHQALGEGNYDGNHPIKRKSED